MALCIYLDSIPTAFDEDEGTKTNRISMPVDVVAVGGDDGSGIGEIVVAFSAAIITRRFHSRHRHTHTHTQIRIYGNWSDGAEPNVETLVNRTVSFALISYLSCVFFPPSPSSSLFCVICRLPYRLRCANAMFHPHTTHSPPHIFHLIGPYLDTESRK